MISTVLNTKQNYNCISSKKVIITPICGIKFSEMIKENSLSFNDKKKADIFIINAIMNTMTTRQRDTEDLTDYTKCFKAVRDLCKEIYGGIFKIPMLIQKETTWASDQEGSNKTAYDSFLSILYLKNTDQAKYG